MIKIEPENAAYPWKKSTFNWSGNRGNETNNGSRLKKEQLGEQPAFVPP